MCVCVCVCVRVRVYMADLRAGVVEHAELLVRLGLGVELDDLLRELLVAVPVVGLRVVCPRASQARSITCQEHHTAGASQQVDRRSITC